MDFCFKMKSDYSFLSSTITISDAISFCKQNHLNSLILCDINLHGAFEFYNLCLNNSIKPILGLEVNITFNQETFPLVFIAKSERGYKNLVKISSYSSRFNVSSLDIKTLGLISQDIIAIIPSSKSYVANKLLENDIFAANSFIDNLKEIFKEIYFGIYRYNGSDDKFLADLKEYANQLDIKCIAFQEVTHKSIKDTVILNLLNCIDKGIPANKEFLKDPSIVEAHLKTPEQLKIYYDNDELVNLNNLIKSINLKINKVDYSLPKICDNPNEKLKELAYEKLNQLELINKKEYVDRAEYELSVIFKMGFANYYLVVSDYVNYAKNNDIPVGPARGSGAASLIAYLLNITTIDPLKYDLLFERFLNPSRSNYPDFDIDFADIKRDEVIKYVKNKYGYRRVANIATFATFGIKSAIRDLARIMKINNEDVNYLVKAISKDAISINSEYNHNKKFHDLLDIHSNFKTLCSLASQIEGLKKQVGLHAAGIILSNDNLDELVPCFEPEEASLAIQFDYVTAEKLGLIKMDFLGLKNLSIIDYAIKRINQEYNKNYTIDNFPFDDKSSYEIIAKCETIGLFQLESEGMQNVIVKMRPNSFNDIVALIALYRPGPMGMIETYIKRKNDYTYKVKDPLLEPILASTYGIIIYQEQIMQICQVAAGYSLGDADILRRAISKKKLDIILNEKQKFINGCLKNNYSKEKAITLFNFIEKFASYGFNKAHSVGYSKIATMMAYIKANYKSIFYEALLNVNQENGEKRKALFYEAKKAGIEIIKPDINNSSLYFKGTGNKIMFGLTSINTIKEPIANIILKERKIAKFESLYDFIIRMALNDVSLQMILDLTYAGALDSFNINRNKITANLNNIYAYALMFKGLNYIPNTYNTNNYSFFDPPLLIKEDLETDFLKKEYEMLSIYISPHPLLKIKESLENISDISSIIDDGCYNIIGKITLIENKKTKNNKPFTSINIEDDTKNINIREYNDPNKYINLFKKGDLIKANITCKNRYFYINEITKMEVN